MVRVGGNHLNPLSQFSWPCSDFNRQKSKYLEQFPNCFFEPTHLQICSTNYIVFQEEEKCLKHKEMHSMFWIHSLGSTNGQNFFLESDEEKG